MAWHCCTNTTAVYDVAVCVVVLCLTNLNDKKKKNALEIDKFGLVGMYEVCRFPEGMFPTTRMYIYYIYIYTWYILWTWNE